jgi:hypothetical protein
MARRAIPASLRNPELIRQMDWRAVLHYPGIISPARDGGLGTMGPHCHATLLGFRKPTGLRDAADALQCVPTLLACSPHSSVTYFRQRNTRRSINATIPNKVIAITARITIAAKTRSVWRRALEIFIR